MEPQRGHIAERLSFALSPNILCRWFVFEEPPQLYHVVQQHLETYLALAREEDWDGHAVPAFVEREFRRYLECGILAHGFARARCAACGHAFLVAFSCKGRALCPSCNACRMAETPAHLVDRAGLERLLRYCARPPFALERIEQVNQHRVVYHLPRPRRDGATQLTLTPQELSDQRAALIPPPRLHRHRYHGLLAPNSPLRAAATAFGRDAEDGCESASEVAPSPAASASAFRSPARYLWTMLRARLFESLPLACPHCGADMRIVAFITEATPVQRILNHIARKSTSAVRASPAGTGVFSPAPRPAPPQSLLPERSFDGSVALIPAVGRLDFLSLIFAPAYTPDRECVPLPEGQLLCWYVVWPAEQSGVNRG